MSPKRRNWLAQLCVDALTAAKTNLPGSRRESNPAYPFRVTGNGQTMHGWVSRHFENKRLPFNEEAGVTRYSNLGRPLVDNIDNLDRATSRVTAPEDMTLFMPVQSDLIAELWDSEVPPTGAAFRHPSYIFGFLNFDTMTRIVAENSPNRILLTIEVKKGTTLAYAPRALGGAADYYNTFKGPKSIFLSFMALCFLAMER